MRSRVATRRSAVPGSNLLRRIAIATGCAVLFVLLVVVASRDAIERAFLQHALATALDADVSLGSLQHHGDLTVIDDVRVVTGLGTTLVADRVSYSTSGDRWEITPLAARLTIPRSALAPIELTRLASASHDLGIGRALIHLRAGEIDLTTDDGVRAVQIAGITGDVHAGPAPWCDLQAIVTDRVAPLGAYAVTAQAPLAGDRRVQTFTADTLPLSGIGLLLGGNGVTFSGGIAHDVNVTLGNAFAATMTIDGVTANIGSAAIAGMHGPLTIVADGLGSAGLDATLQPAGIPLALTGEVHDGVDPAAGSRDLHMIGDMVARIAAQPNLRWSNVETTAPGVVYGQYAMTTKGVPHVVQMIAIDPHEPTVHFDTALSDDHVISTGARTTDLGLRTHAVAGINGDYFDIGRTYEPQGLLIRSGVLVHGPTDHEALIIDRANRPTFARFHLRGTVRDGARRYPLTLFNSWPTRAVALMTPDYGAKIPAAPGVTFAALEPLGGTQYRVTSLQPMTSSIPTVLGLGFGRELHEPLPKAGDTLDVTYALDPPVAGAVAGIGSGPLLLHDGKWFEDRHAPAPDERDVQWPVIAFGTLSDGKLAFVSVDGRHPERSIGMTRPEFAGVMSNLGVVDAMALDSGGSVTMVARSPGAHVISLHNVPSDFSEERYVSDALFVYSSAPEGTIVTAPRPHVEPTPAAR